MNNDFLWNLQQVADGISRGVLEERAKRSFLYPHDNIWPKEPSQLATLADTIYENLNSNQRKWFLSVCLASFLLNQKKSPTFKSWFHSKAIINEVIGLEFTWDEITAYNWGRIAIPGTDQAEGWNSRIIYALAAVSKSDSSVLYMPTWCNRCLSSDSYEAVQIAAELIANRNSNKRIIFWPQLDPTNPNTVISGASLGLPIFLSFCSLTANKPIPPILATGRIDNNGMLHEVAGLEEKFRLAHKKGFSSFLYPLLPGVKPLDYNDKVDLIGVQDLELAHSTWISPKVTGSDNSVNAWMASIVDKVVDQLSEIKNSLSQSRILINLGTVMLFLLLGAFFYFDKQFTKNSKTETKSDLQVNDDMPRPLMPQRSNKTSLLPEESTPSSMVEAPKHQANTVAKQHKEMILNSVPGSPAQLAPKDSYDLNTAIENRQLTENDDNSTTLSCFRVAKDMMVSSKLVSAKQKYEECFNQNTTYLDTLLDYQKLIKAIEGESSARMAFKRLQEIHPNNAVAFTGILLCEPKTRYVKIKEFIETNQDFLPAYYWLGMDCYEAFGADEVCDSYLNIFIVSARSGRQNRYFINNARLLSMIDEANNIIKNK